MTAKTDEVFAWKKYAEAAGRTDDLLIVDSDAEHCFNFLSYELHRPGAGAGHTENLVNLFCSVLEASERRHGQGSGGDATPSDARLDALKRYRQAVQAVGQNLSAVLLPVVLLGWTIKRVAEGRGASEEKVSGYLAAALDRLDEHYNPEVARR